MAKFKHINRVEVIDEDGRSYYHHLVESLEFSVQDGGKTLKLFINKNLNTPYHLTNTDNPIDFPK